MPQLSEQDEGVQAAADGSRHHSITWTIFRGCERLDRFVAGNHPRATIFHPQWLSIRAQCAGMAHAAQSARGLLVDIGCGNTPFEDLFRERIERYVGMDYPATARLVGASRAQVHATARHLPLADASVETLLLTEVLEHLREPGPVLEELSRVLKPGGVLIVSAPMIYNVHGAPHDFFRFTPDGLRYVLERAGFQIVKLWPQGYAGTMLGLMTNNFLTVVFGRTRLLRAIRWTVLLPVLPLVFAWNNLLGLLLDAVVREPSFSFNHVAIARQGAA